MSRAAARARFQQAPLLLLAAWTAGLVALAPGDVTWYDSGELAASAALLAPSHPPGQPLHALLGRLATLLPLGPVAFRTTLLSILAAAAALWLLYRIVASRHGPEAGLTAAGLLGLSWALAEQASRTEVYTLALAGCLAALALWRPASVRSQLAASLAASLSAGAHPMAGGAAWLALAAVGLSWGQSRRGRILAAALVGLVAGSAIWLLLPAAAHRTPVAWSDLESPAGLVRTVLGQAYATNFQASHAPRFWLVVGQLRLLGRLAGPVWLVALLGLAAAFRRPRALAPAAALGAAGLVGPLTLGVLMPENPDLHGYFLPALAALAWLATGGLVELSRRRPPVVRALLLAVALGVTALAQTRPVAERLSWDQGPDLLLVGAGAAAAPGPGLLVVESDHYLFPLLYARTVEGFRPDLALVNRWLVAADAPWYRRAVKATWPWLWIPLLDGPGRTRLRLNFVARNAARMPVYAEGPEPGWQGLLADCGLLVGHGARSPCLASASFPETLTPPSARLVACHEACRRARRLAALGEYSRALAQLSPFLAGLPARWPGAAAFLCSQGEPLVLAARIHLAQGDLEGARPLLERARRTDPRYPETYLVLGRLAAAGGRASLAEKFFLEAIRLAPRDARAWAGAAWAAHALGRRTEARRRLQRALELDPSLARRLRGPKGAGRESPNEAGNR